MSKQVRLRRGTTLQHLSFVGAEGEVTYDTERKCLLLHDGVSLGGRPVMVLTPGNPALTQMVTSPVALSGGSSSVTGLTVYNAALLSGPTTIGDLMSPTVTMGGAGGVIVDFTAGRLQMVTPVLSDISLTSTNRLPSRCCWVFLTCGATGRSVSFPAGWKFVGGAAPTSIAANKTALLELWCLGSNESDVMARWSAQT